MWLPLVGGIAATTAIQNSRARFKDACATSAHKSAAMPENGALAEIDADLS